MEKLSRSQRYANLRDNITADREENTTTQDLSQYQNRLNGVEDSFNRINPAAQFTQQPVYSAPQQQPVYQQPAQPVYQQPAQPAFTAPEQPAFTAPEQPVYTAPVQQNSIDALLESLEQQVNIQNEAPKVQAQPTEELSLDDFLNSLDFGTPAAPEQPVQAQSVTPVQPVYQQPAQPVYQQPAQAESNVNVNIKDSFDFDSFINETLNEVDDYNKGKGLATMDQISQNIITEIQNEVPSQQQTFAPLDSAPAYSAPIIEPVQVTVAPIVQPVQQPAQPAKNSFIDDFLSKEEPSMEHPVAYQTLEENKNEEPVEIVNLAELEKTESLTKTVTFAAVEEDTETDIDTPNKVLNVLLVVLIVALFLVLGFVVYELISANII